MLFVPPFIPAGAQSEPYMGAIVELDKAVYSWTDVVWIYITAPNFNSEPTEIDYIGCGGNIHLIGDKNQCSQSLITVTATNVVNNVSMGIEKLDYYVLEETGPDTGIFWGAVFLTGFPHDVDGDGKDDPYKLYQNQYFNENILSVLDMKANEDLTGTTSGTGPWDGRIKVNPGNTITVKFTSLLPAYSGDTRIVEAKAEVNFWLGEFGVLKYAPYYNSPHLDDESTVESDNESYIIRAGEPVTVTVRDPDRNILPFVTDVLTVNVYSDSDPVGIQLELQSEYLDEDGGGGKKIPAFWQDSVVFTGLGNTWILPGGTVIFSDCTPLDVAKGICADPYGEVAMYVQSDEYANEQSTCMSWHTFCYVFAKHGDTITFEYADCTLPSPDLDREDCLHLALRAKLKDVKLVTEEPAPTAETSIPSWIKNNAGWWADGIIDDSSFLQGIEYLINEGIIVIPENVRSPSASTEEHMERLGLTPATPEVPGWVKNNAGWWAEGQIDDSSFLQGIQYLVKEGIIKVS